MPNPTNPNLSSLDDFDIDINQLNTKAAYAGSMLANSALPSVMGQLTARKSLTHDSGIAGSVVIDESPSMLEAKKIKAVIDGFNEFLRIMSGVKKEVRTQVFLQRIRYSGRYLNGPGTQSKNPSWVDLGDDTDDDERYVDQIWEDHTLTRLVDPSDPKKLNVPLLTAKEYDPSRGYATATVPALMKVHADHLLWEAGLQHPDIDAIDFHVIGLFSDGFGNIGGRAKTAQFRNAIRSKRMQEQSNRWKFFAFIILSDEEVDMFIRYMQKYSWTGSREQARDLMAHAAFTGWGYYANTEADIDKLADPTARETAQLYLKAERAIDSMIMQYCMHGGLGFPPENVFSAAAEPEQIAHMLGVQMSSSFANASTSMVSTSVTTTSPATDDDQQSGGKVW